MSEETLRCPSCATGMLSTPLIRISTEDGRKAKSLPFKWCRFCEIIIPNSIPVKVWSSEEIVTCQ